MMKSERFRVARRFAGTAYDLVGQPHPLPLLKSYYEPLTPFIKAIGYGLFALTKDDPGQFQEVTAGELLDVLEVAKHSAGDNGPAAFHGQHYQDAFRALERLFNVAIPMKTKWVRWDGRRWVAEYRIDFVRLLDGFGLVYLHPDTGKLLTVYDDARFAQYRVDIANRYEQKDQTPTPNGDQAATTGKRHRRKNRQRKDDDRQVWALVALDDKGSWRKDEEGKPILLPPARYRFRWGREVQADLLRQPEGRGWLTLSRDIFRVLRVCRHANNGRGNPTAAYLLELILSDILGKGPTRQILEKPAKLIFYALGFPEPGSLTKGSLDKRDGRWTENVARIAAAVRLLKTEGVLLPESDEEPFVDPNPDRRKAPYYRWKRAAKWTTTTAIEIVDEIEAREAAKAATAMEGDNQDALAVTSAVQQSLFGESPPGSGPRGRDIRAAREAAGLTLRDFAARFGRSIKFWSDVETEAISRRTGSPRAVPMDILDQVEAFIAEHKREGT
jgi:hypothetical protein